MATLTGFVQNAHELYVARFVLGLAEAGYVPGIRDPPAQLDTLRFWTGHCGDRLARTCRNKALSESPGLDIRVRCFARKRLGWQAEKRSRNCRSDWEARKSRRQPTRVSTTFHEERVVFSVVRSLVHETGNFDALLFLIQRDPASLPIGTK